MSGRRRGGTLPAVSAAGVLELLRMRPGNAWSVNIVCDDMVLHPSTKPRRLQNGVSLRLVWRSREDGMSLTMAVTLTGWSPAMLLRIAGPPPCQVRDDHA